MDIYYHICFIQNERSTNKYLNRANI